MSTRSARPLLAAALAASSLVLAGCAGTVALEPAVSATDPGCAEVSVRLPDVVADQQQRETNAQGTAAWGSPTAIILHCGVAVPGPTTLECNTVADIDWIQDDSAADEGVYTFTTYGRDPAVEVTVDQDLASGSSALIDLSSAMSTIEQTRACTSVADTLDPDAAPAG